jgi:hypothetical protein
VRVCRSAGAGEVLPLLRMCFVLAVRDVLAFCHSVGQPLLCADLQVPAKSCCCSACASCLLCAMSLRFVTQWGNVFSAQIAQVPATSCHCCSRPGSSARAPCLLRVMFLCFITRRGNASLHRSRRCRRRLAVAPCMRRAHCA